jgi:hypothetical protein
MSSTKTPPGYIEVSSPASTRSWSEADVTHTPDLNQGAAARYRAACAARGLPVWWPGMLSTHQARFMGGNLWQQRVGGIFADPNDPKGGEEPDFADPATLGCLLAAVREAWACPVAFVQCVPGVGGWTAVSLDHRLRFSFRGDTEVEALIAALEAAAARRGGQP